MILGGRNQQKLGVEIMTDKLKYGQLDRIAHEGKMNKRLMRENEEMKEGSMRDKTVPKRVNKDVW